MLCTWVYFYACSLSHTLTGEVINDRDRCPQCKGSKVTQEKKVLEVHVEKGMRHGEKIVFDGQADQAVSNSANCSRIIF